jgi:hypothetical protein
MYRSSKEILLSIDFRIHLKYWPWVVHLPKKIPEPLERPALFYFFAIVVIFKIFGGFLKLPKEVPAYYPKRDQSFQMFWEKDSFSL